ncbi:hypothetical protein OG900_04745 [Streptomyces sp. NBC_00433]
MTPAKASGGTERAWQQAIDHGFFIIWDLAMGGNYPDGISGTKTPTAATTSGGTLSADRVARWVRRPSSRSMPPTPRPGRRSPAAPPTCPSTRPPG